VKREKKKKEVVEEAPAEVPTTDVPEDAEIDDVEDTEVMKKPRKEKKEKQGEIVVSVEELSPIAHPLAQRKLLKKLNKVVKKASKARQVKRGVKEVVKGIRKGEKGILVLAADITPIDIISHLPVMCEDARIPYAFVPSKEELGHASATKRPTSCVMVCPNLKKKPKAKDGKASDATKDLPDDEFKELYAECFKEVQSLDQKILY